jgi:hypothetical protein
MQLQLVNIYGNPVFIDVEPDNTIHDLMIRLSLEISYRGQPLNPDHTVEEVMQAFNIQEPIFRIEGTYDYR